jgi:RNA polymerase sigma-70 factor (ECF subfamily)
MFEDEIVSSAAPVKTLAGALGRSESSRPSPLEDEVAGLFDQLRDRLLRYLLSLGLSIADGEEVVQEVFLALFQHLRRGKPRHNLRGWVFQVAHNLGLRRHNSARRDRENLLEFGGNPAANTLTQPPPNPEDQFARNQRLVRFTGVWHALP